ncbi:hypothetical protein N826_13105 [Skermanella aerolata KACC 11604]|nr:hypothetical protein N826_13105 [Skermanella aerolata KACC 11604]
MSLRPHRILSESSARLLIALWAANASMMASMIL